MTTIVTVTSPFLERSPCVRYTCLRRSHRPSESWLQSYEAGVAASTFIYKNTEACRMEGPFARLVGKQEVEPGLEFSAGRLCPSPLSDGTWMPALWKKDPCGAHAWCWWSGLREGALEGTLEVRGA